MKNLFQKMILICFFLVSSVAISAPAKVLVPPQGQNQTAQSIAGRADDGSEDLIPAKITTDGALYVTGGTPTATTVRSMDAFGTVGVGTPVLVNGAQDIYAVVSCSTPGCNKQIRFQAAWQADDLLSQSDFLSSSGTLSAPWDYISYYDISNPSSLIVGDTGHNHTGQVTRVFLLNVDGAVQITPRVVTSSAVGNVTVDITYFSGN